MTQTSERRSPLLARATRRLLEGDDELRITYELDDTLRICMRIERRALRKGGTPGDWRLDGGSIGVVQQSMTPERFTAFYEDIGFRVERDEL